MARVLQRRPSPPYLLIVFVFLFLVAATLAVLFYTKMEDARKLADQQTQDRQKLATDPEMRKGFVVERTKAAAAPTPGPRPAAGSIYDEFGQPDSTKEAQLAKQRSVVNRLDENLVVLAQLVKPGLTAAQGDVIGQFIEAAKELNDAQKLVREWKSLEVLDAQRLAQGDPATQPAARSTAWAGVYKELQTAYEGKFVPQMKVCAMLGKDIESLKKDIETRDKRLTDLGEEVKTLSAKIEEQTTQLNTAKTEVGALKGQFAAASKLSDDRKAMLEEATKKVNDQAAALGDLTKKYEDVKAKVVTMKLEKRVRDIRTEMALHADGEITKVVQDQNRCYINRGVRDGVDVGLTFGVYPRATFLKSPKSKAQVTVLKAEESISLCSITSQDPKMPVESGDIIANLVFDSQRKYKFVIEGQFDLYNTGRPVPTDRQEVVLLTRKFGGEVVDKLDVDVDYVVMGIPPKLPDKLEDASEDQDRVRAAKEAYDHYKEVQRAAEKFNIPILNTNRFLDLVGYTPQKSLFLPK